MSVFMLGAPKSSEKSKVSICKFHDNRKQGPVFSGLWVEQSHVAQYEITGTCDGTATFSSLSSASGYDHSFIAASWQILIVISSYTIFSFFYF